eukprot:TRINITY_DN21425_c0_g1_i1.p1 TRINITY_DN21425_c0_g1~~TRINITY_DN21425_c0_g1_i1.p1  ORF type:complete len:544 (+),score=75.45 TRINITY_DN21425_c0_g1_i1:248-1879(+)
MGDVEMALRSLGGGIGEPPSAPPRFQALDSGYDNTMGVDAASASVSHHSAAGLPASSADLSFPSTASGNQQHESQSRSRRRDKHASSTSRRSRPTLERRGEDVGGHAEFSFEAGRADVRSHGFSGTGFDFEAAAFGAESDGPRPVQSSVPSLAHVSGGFGCGGVVGADATGAAVPSSEKHATLRTTPWDGPACADELRRKLGDSTYDSACPTASELLVRELVSGRREIERSLSDKHEMLQRIQHAREQLERVRRERQTVMVELKSRQCEVEHLSSSLDFNRQQIDETEREVAALREKRREREMEATHATSSFGVAPPSLRSMHELSDKTRRASRAKMDLLAKQQLLLDAQQRAEQDRSHLQRQLDSERDRLNSMQTDRLLLGDERLGVIQQAGKLAQEAGLGPGGLQELLRTIPVASKQSPDATGNASASARLSDENAFRRDAGLPLEPTVQQPRSRDTQMWDDASSGWQYSLARGACGAPAGPASAVAGSSASAGCHASGTSAGTGWARFGDASRAVPAGNGIEQDLRLWEQRRAQAAQGAA